MDMVTLLEQMAQMTHYDNQLPQITNGQPIQLAFSLLNANDKSLAHMSHVVRL